MTEFVDREENGKYKGTEFVDREEDGKYKGNRVCRQRGG